MIITAIKTLEVQKKVKMRGLDTMITIKIKYNGCNYETTTQ